MIDGERGWTGPHGRPGPKLQCQFQDGDGTEGDDPYDDGLPPIVGPSVMDEDEEKVKPLLNARSRRYSVQ